jgi:hypothetical protein
MSAHKHPLHADRPALWNHAHASTPFWKRAHRDWRTWFVVLLMLAMMIVYIMTSDLSWRPGGHAVQRMPAAVPAN